jgi:hypothetical protein
MKYICKIAAYLFPNSRGDTSLLLFAFVSAASACGLVAAGLWLAHTPSAMSPSIAMQPECLDRCEKVCGADER